MQKLNVGDKVYKIMDGLTYAFTVDALTNKMAKLSNGVRLWNAQVYNFSNEPAYSIVANPYLYYLASTPELIAAAQRTQLINKANHAVNTAKHTTMTDEELKTIINIYNKY